MTSEEKFNLLDRSVRYAPWGLYAEQIGYVKYVDPVTFDCVVVFIDPVNKGRSIMVSAEDVEEHLY